jgi:hypothetical protein
MHLNSPTKAKLDVGMGNLSDDSSPKYISPLKILV